MNMDRTSLCKQYFKQVITDYKGFDNDSSAYERKVKHSSRVADNALKIAKSENLNLELSYIIGLLHDIGRFEQLKRNVAFKDDNVFDHGDCSEEMFLASDFAKNFTAREQHIIAKALKNHNKFAIEEGLDDETLIYCKMVKDADKIDLIKLATLNPSFTNDEVSPKVIEDFNNQGLVYRINIKTNQDRLIAIMSFVFDINYNLSIQLLKDDLNKLKTFCTHLDKLIDF